MFIYLLDDASTFAEFCNINLNMSEHLQCLQDCSVNLFRYMSDLNTESYVYRPKEYL